MLENYKLPNKLRSILERELDSSEIIQWIEQPIPRFFTRSTLSICLSLLVPLFFFSFASVAAYQQAIELEINIFEFVGFTSILIFSISTIIPLVLIFLIPVLQWQEARQTVYVITNQRAFILVAAWSLSVTSFIASELRVILRREYRDGSGDVIVYVHRSSHDEENGQAHEMGFKQVHDSRAFERMLRHLYSLQ